MVRFLPQQRDIKCAGLIQQADPCEMEMMARSSVRMVVASENSIHLTRSHRRIRPGSLNVGNRPLVRPYAARLLQAATAAGSRNPDTAASTQRPAAAHATPATAFALDRPRPVHLALSSLPAHS